jgi:hypothetical protein
MFDPNALIEELATRGITLIAEPPDLLAESAGPITEADRQTVQQYNEQLLAALIARHEAEEIDRIARLDRVRNEHDRRLGRGYDYAG